MERKNFLFCFSLWKKIKGKSAPGFCVKTKPKRDNIKHALF